MQNLIVASIQFPEFTGVQCNMMPFVQGDSSSLPEIYKPYSAIVDENFLEKGEIGFLTIQESFVDAGKSQRGYGGTLNRNVHVEVGRYKNLNHWGDSGGGNGWGGRFNTLLDDATMILIANSISDTCRVWDAKEMAYTKDGDLSNYLNKYPEETGILLKSGDIAKISIFTPHECIPQSQSDKRQFLRIVGKGVRGREDYFTINPLVLLN